MPESNPTSWLLAQIAVVGCHAHRLSCLLQYRIQAGNTPEPKFVPVRSEPGLSYANVRVGKRAVVHSHIEGRPFA
jgi:hypothetical protein